MLNSLLPPPSERFILNNSSTAPDDIKRVALRIQTTGVVGVPSVDRDPPVLTVQSGPLATSKGGTPEVGASVQWLMDDIESLVLSETKRLFNSAFSARGAQRTKAVAQLRRLASPELLIDAAILEFRSNGNEDRLDFASTLLLDYPKENVLQAIESITERDVPEVTSFLGVIDFLDAPSTYRSRLLGRLSRSRNSEVLYAVRGGL